MSDSISVMFGGDVMLGRLVGDEIRKRGYIHPLGGIAQLMSSADITIVNLECAITSSRTLWHGADKAFYFGAPPEAVKSLVEAGVDMVSFANNHSLDYDYEGLVDTLKYLKTNNIKYSGAGANTKESLRPAFIEKKGIKIGMVSYCDHQGDFAATDTMPGIAYLDMDDEQLTIDTWRRELEIIKEGGADWPVLSLHWGPNMVERPSKYFIKLAHAAIDMGYRIIFGHSAHVFHGIEIYKGSPIIYSTGDLVDDYYVDSYFKNDHSLLFEMEISKFSLKKLTLHPVFIEECQVSPAKGRQTVYIAGKMTELCAELGTTIRYQDDTGSLEVLF